MVYGGFAIDRHNVDGKVRLVLAGELDIAQVDRLNGELDRCADRDTVQIDTTELIFIDSTGLGALVAARNRLGPDRFDLIPGEAVRRILDLTGTEDHLLE